MAADPDRFPCHQCGRHFKSLNSHYSRSSCAKPSREPELIAAPPPITSESIVSLLVNLRSTRRVIRRIPKGARNAAASCLSAIIDRVVRDNSVASWNVLFCFPAACLQIPAISQEISASLATRVKTNISQFREGLVLPSASPVSKPKKSATRDIGKIVEAKLSDGDVTGAVRVICSDAAFAPNDADCLAALRSKHPPGTGHDDFSFESEDWASLTHLIVADSDVRKAISSFPSGSAGGLDSLTPQHLKDLIGPSSGSSGECLLKSLTALANLMLGGHVPQAICPVLYGASLCALKKKDGGIRPIAVGSTLRRLVAKLGCTHVAPTLGPALRPTQLGFGTPGGAEAASHAARRFVNHPHLQPTVLLKIDYVNAFNMVRRDRLLECVYRELPDLYLFLRQCYMTPSCLTYGDAVIASERGVQQGDPLGPALFCLISQRVASVMRAELNVWYLDDSSLGGAPEAVLRDLTLLKELSSDIGLVLNPSKCELLILGPGGVDDCQIRTMFAAVVPGIKIVDRPNFVLLGAPLSNEAISSCLASKIEALKTMTGNLSQVSSHHGFFLLKNSLAIPRLLYLLRSAPVWQCEDGLNALDETVRVALQDVTNTTMDGSPWLQSSLPVGKGGLGIRHSAKLALPAFLSSYYSVDELVRQILPVAISDSGDPSFHDAVQQWELLTGAVLPSPDHRRFQRAWESAIVDKSVALLSSNASSARDKARLFSVSSRESGAWLNTLPSASLGTLLDDDSFRIAVGLRLGSQVVSPHTCNCGSAVDGFGSHGLSCKKSSGRLSRHGAVNDILRRALVSAGIPAILEPPGLSRDDGRRPDGMTLVPWCGGRSLVWDFTCTDPLAPSYLAHSSSAPLWAASQAEQKKKVKYMSLEQRYIFRAVAVETLGSFGRASNKNVDLTMAIGK